MKTRIQKIIARSLSLCLATALLGASAQAATTLVILEDTFTAPYSWGGYLTGRTPDTSLPGTTWTCVWLESSNTNSQPFVHNSNVVRTLFNGAGYIDISSTGSYAKPTTMTISADLTINGLTGGSTNGIGLGFFSSSPAQAGGQSIVGFTGLVLSPDGTLNLMSNGVGVTAYTAPIPGFATTTTYNLSYSIDTTTGGITSVSLNGSDLGSIFSSVTGIFTDSATVYAGFFGRSNAYGSTGIIDNFKLTTVIPEASAIWLIAPAFAFALMLKRRRK